MVAARARRADLLRGPLTPQDGQMVCQRSSQICSVVMMDAQLWQKHAFMLDSAALMAVLGG